MPTTQASAWWRGSRPTIAWCWNNERAPHLHAPSAAFRNRALSVDGGVLPGAVRFRAQDQPVADRDRAAAVYTCVRSNPGFWGAQGGGSRTVAGQFPPAGFRQPLHPVLSAQPGGRRGLDLDPARHRLTHRLLHWAAAAALAGDCDDAGDRAVLDLVPDPNL